MNDILFSKTQPIPVVRSRRLEEVNVLTSGMAGKIIPLKYIPVLREDAVQAGRVRLKFKMEETASPLMTGVNVQVNAYFVPALALDRFTGMESFNRSYAGEPEIDDSVIPFVETAAFGAHGASEIFSTMGLHGKATDQVNTSIVESYNQIVNFRRKMRSKSLTPRTLTDDTLAEAFWHHTYMKHIVPDFDQAHIDGEVELAVVNSQLPVTGIGLRGDGLGVDAGVNEAILETGGVAGTYAKFAKTETTNIVTIEANPADGAPLIFAEMQQGGLKVSLANIELVKKTRAFANARKQMKGVDDEHILDLLMQGFRVPEQAYRQPMLMAQKNALFGYSQRFATDAGNQDQSVTDGMVQMDINLRLPAITTGGVIMITAEIVPEQMFERQKDYYLHANTVDDFPKYDSDFLDPEKVAVVSKDHVDVQHSDGAGTFGYAPLNHEWNRSAPNIGGKFLRPEVNTAFDEDRQRLWAAETLDPVLGPDFYMVTDLHNKMFEDTLSDSFEIQARGLVMLQGLTVFGAQLQEATDDYAKVLTQVDQTKIVK